MATTKHHISVNTTMEPGGKIGDDSPNTNAWYRFQEKEGQKWVVLDGKLIPKRTAILDSFSNKFTNQSPWNEEELKQTGKGGVTDAITETLNSWKMNSVDFHLPLADKLAQSKASYQTKKLKLHYQKAMKMANTALTEIPGYKKYTEDGVTHEALPMTIVTEFWLAAVYTFGTLYEPVFTSVYSRHGKAKMTPPEAKPWITEFLASFPDLAPFTKLTLFEEGAAGAHDLCNKVARAMTGGSSLDNWKKTWQAFLLKKQFDDLETTLLMLGIRLASSPPDIHQGWIGEELPATIITEAWVGAGEVFGELWVQDTVMEEADTATEDSGEVTPSMSTPTKTLRFTEASSILKEPSVSKRKPIGFTQPYFRPRSNLKPKKKKGLFRTMVFKTYLELSIPISIQAVTEFGETEEKVLAALTSIWRTLTSIDQHTVILSWHPKVEDTLRPLRSVDFTTKPPKKKALNDRYIDMLQMGWFTADTKIRFRVGHNQTIASLLEDPNLVYILDNYDAALTKDKIQSTETAIAVWLGGPIPAQATLEAIEQTLLESTEFKRYDIDQVELLIKRIILKPGKQRREDKKVHAIHVVIPEDKKAQARKALKAIYPSRPHNNYPEGIQWRAIENIADRDFTVTEQSSIVAERMKFKQSAFLQDLCTTEYKHLQNVNAEVDIEPYLPLSQILMSLKSHSDPAKGLFVMVQQEYDDEPVTFSYMAEVSQEVAAILPILPLLLEGRLGMNVSQYFRSSYTIGTDGYKWDSTLDKVVPTVTDNYLEDIDRHWIQHTDDCTMRNKKYKEEDHGGYAINVGAFDIDGTLGNPRIMEDGNESLQTMGLNASFHDTNGYMDIEVNEDTTPNTDGTEVSTFTTETPVKADEQLLDILSKNQDTIPPELMEYLKQKSGIPSQGGRGDQ